jgi:hypothetical protein
VTGLDLINTQAQRITQICLQTWVTRFKTQATPVVGDSPAQIIQVKIDIAHIVVELGVLYPRRQ